ncbi:MAG TPA: replication-associated recombination protein A, partial [Candidatus Binatia bacterium]|nr:replication-associated recombination protein A [Candidatus Binatia bacterium]
AAQERRRRSGARTIVFIDEIHRFNKAQQDAFLPHVESGEIVLVGATTENPSFEINAPLLSRCRVIVLSALTDDEMATVLERAMADSENGFGASGITLEPEACAFLASSSHGDARGALGALEAAMDLARAEGRNTIDLELAEQGLQKKALLYDQGGDEHYNVISAFVKSMRGSDADASLYWLARMLEAGEDPIFIARRMVVFASEDIGLADADALPLAVAARDAVAFVGLPEARINLQHVVAYLALAPKSNAAYMAGEAAIAEVKATGALPVPIHLRNAPTGLMRKLGYGKDYVYPHGQEEAARDQSYLPERIRSRKFLRRDRRDKT